MHLNRWVELAGLATCAAALAGCGGGGGGGVTAEPGIAGGATTQLLTAGEGGDGEALLASPEGGEAVAQGASSGGTGDLMSTASAAGGAPMLGDCELFPSTAVFNTPIDDVSRFPAHPRSGDWIARVGGEQRMQADWWLGEDPSRRDAYYGMPINVIDGGATDWPVVSFDFAPSGVSMDQGYAHVSDCAVDGSIRNGCSTLPPGERRFPFPRDNVKNEGGICDTPNVCGDHHVLVVEQGACRLWESFSAYKLSGQWYAMSTAAWNMRSLALRPDGWTSGDAAGLPITPFLAKAAEASAGEIRHALRVTFSDAVLDRRYEWPARHASGGHTPGGIPFGAVLRLRADFQIPDNWTPQARAVAQAAKRYGMYVADIGENFYVQGEPNAMWDENTFRQLKTIALSQMDFVDLGAITSDPRFSRDSMAGRW